MIAMAAIIERFESDYLKQYQHAILPSHRHALQAMKRCRSSSGLHLLAQCGNCDERRFVPHSCGHRNCPHCQHFESQRWIERQTRLLVPGNYFLITFTLPAELRGLAWHHQRTVYDTLMGCAWETLRTFSQNHKQLQGSPGAVAVLHTHSRKLDFHPHVHLAMPGAALDSEKGLWRSLRKSAKGDGYLFNHLGLIPRPLGRYLEAMRSEPNGCPVFGYLNTPQLAAGIFIHKALAKVFATKLLAALRAQGLELPPSLPLKWVVTRVRQLQL